MANLNLLPTELLQEIASSAILSCFEKAQLARTSRRLCNIVTPILYQSYECWFWFRPTLRSETPIFITRSRRTAFEADSLEKYKHLIRDLTFNFEVRSLTKAEEMEELQRDREVALRTDQDRDQGRVTTDFYSSPAVTSDGHERLSLIEFGDFMRSFSNVTTLRFDNGMKSRVLPQRWLQMRYRMLLGLVENAVHSLKHLQKLHIATIIDDIGHIKQFYRFNKSPVLSSLKELIFCASGSSLGYINDKRIIFGELEEALHSALSSIQTIDLRLHSKFTSDGIEPGQFMASEFPFSNVSRLELDAITLCEDPSSWLGVDPGKIKTLVLYCYEDRSSMEGTISFLEPFHNLEDLEIFELYLLKDSIWDSFVPTIVVSLPKIKTIKLTGEQSLFNFPNTDRNYKRMKRSYMEYEVDPLTFDIKLVASLSRITKELLAAV